MVTYVGYVQSIDRLGVARVQGGMCHRLAFKRTAGVRSLDVCEVRSTPPPDGVLGPGGESRSCFQSHEASAHFRFRDALVVDKPVMRYVTKRVNTIRRVFDETFGTGRD
jgi:hypothetical protein